MLYCYMIRTTFWYRKGKTTFYYGIKFSDVFDFNVSTADNLEYLIKRKRKIFPVMLKKYCSLYCLLQNKS